MSPPENGASTVLEGSDGEQEGQFKKKRSSFDKSQLPEELTSKYEVLEKIGSGSFGTVYRVRNSNSGGIFAAKYSDTREAASEVSKLVKSKMTIKVCSLHLNHKGGNSSQD